MHWFELGTALFVYLIVLTVPGPVMVVVYNHSVQRKYNASILTGVGCGLAATTLAALSYVGVSAVKDKFVNFEEFMFIASGLLLIWFGLKVKIIKDLNESIPLQDDLNAMSYLASAFMLNLFNPKALALFTTIYGGVLLGISLFEAVLFMLFCLVLEIVWYYMLYHIFSSDVMIQLSGKFIAKITYTSKTLLLAMGGYFLLHSLFVIVTRGEIH